MATSDHDIVVGENLVSIHRYNSSEVTIANILGRQTTDGQDRIYLDRLVHHPGAHVMGEWAVSGAISTVLSKPAE